ncbi:MAG: endonuclease III [Gammaproteobacteria bacterium]
MKPPPASHAWSRRRANAFFACLERICPNPVTELRYETPFQLLAAVLLSAQSTDREANRATEKLFQIAPTPKALIALGTDRLETHLRRLGLYRRKTRHLLASCQLLIERFDGEIPSRREDLEQLPGIGRKSANVILNALYGAPTIAVDTHVFRVANRTGLAPGNTPHAVEKRLHETVPERYQTRAHHWLVLHGRYVCRARTPRCPECVVSHLCTFTDKTPRPSRPPPDQPD